jgi:hypothetical protein
MQIGFGHGEVPTSILAAKRADTNRLEASTEAMSGNWALDEDYAALLTTGRTKSMRSIVAAMP